MPPVSSFIHALLFCFCLVSTGLAQSASTESKEGVSTDWVGTDRYGRTMADISEAGPKRDGKIVGIFYYLWHGPHTPPWENNVTKYLRENDGDMRAMSVHPVPNSESPDPWTYYGVQLQRRFCAGTRI